MRFIDKATWRARLEMVRNTAGEAGGGIGKIAR